MTAHGTTPGPCPAGMVTFGGAEWDWDRISKVRARPPVRNEQGNKFISGFYMLGPKLRPLASKCCAKRVRPTSSGRTP